MKQVLLFTNIFPHYRRSLWEKLINCKDFNIEIYYDNKDYIEIKNLAKNSIFKSKYGSLNYIKNLYFLDKILLWQSGVIFRCIFKKYDTIIFLGEFTCLSTWLGSLIGKIKKKKIIFWGHGLYGNESLLKKIIRILFLKLASHNLVYEKRSKKLLTDSGIDANKISVIFNSIDYQKQKEIYKKLEKSNPFKIFENKYPTLFFVGRLTPQKKIDMLINAVKKINEKFDVNLLIVGAGPSLKSLKLLAENLINQKKCIFFGECMDEKILSKLIYNSDLTVSPGNVGLTAIHSLSYGPPVCTHSNFSNQMPEAECIREGDNGFFFHENDINSLEKKIYDWLRNGKRFNRDEVRNVIDKYYNENYQIKIITKVV